MAFKKRRMLFVPEVNPTSFVFFFERGSSGSSWSIRDYSIKNRVKEYGPAHFRWTANDIHGKAQHSLDAPTVETGNLDFWHEHTNQCNVTYLCQKETPRPVSETTVVSAKQFNARPPSIKLGSSFAVLNLDGLNALPKGRKARDMDRILHSPNSEDWVTWNFFQIMLQQYPAGWWSQVLHAIKRRNPWFEFPFDEHSLPSASFWVSVRAPLEYEAESRLRMKASGNDSWLLRAADPAPVEGASEIDVTFDHPEFLIFAEAKLGSDVSLSTTYDSHRNQIVRNIDCLIEKAGDRTPFFWLLVRDDAPSRAYVQLMNAYKDDPATLARDLPHRRPSQLEHISKNLALLRWIDLSELVCELGPNSEVNAVKNELQRRIS